MSKNKYRIGPDATIEDVDLDHDEVRLRDGTRLSDDLAIELADETRSDARRKGLIPGGKSLSGDGSHSPTVQFRVPAELRSAAEVRAAAEGITVSRLAREALERYLAS